MNNDKSKKQIFIKTDIKETKKLSQFNKTYLRSRFLYAIPFFDNRGSKIMQMQYTLHLTDACNMNCKSCISTSLDMVNYDITTQAEPESINPELNAVKTPLTDLVWLHWFRVW